MPTSNNPVLTAKERPAGGWIIQTVYHDMGRPVRDVLKHPDGKPEVFSSQELADERIDELSPVDEKKEGRELTSRELEWLQRLDNAPEGCVEVEHHRVLLVLEMRGFATSKAEPHWKGRDRWQITREGRKTLLAQDMKGQD